MPNKSWQKFQKLGKESSQRLSGGKQKPLVTEVHRHVQRTSYGTALYHITIGIPLPLAAPSREGKNI